MFWGFGYGLLFLLPLLFLAKFFWIVLLFVLIGAMIRRFSCRHWQVPTYYYKNGQIPPYYTPGRSPFQPGQLSALEILRQRYARGEIDAVTYEQMRERLEASSGPSNR